MVTRLGRRATFRTKLGAGTHLGYGRSALRAESGAGAQRGVAITAQWNFRSLSGRHCARAGGGRATFKAELRARRQRTTACTTSGRCNCCCRTAEIGMAAQAVLLRADIGGAALGALPLLFHRRPVSTSRKEIRMYYRGQPGQKLPCRRFARLRSRAIVPRLPAH